MPPRFRRRRYGRRPGRRTGLRKRLAFRGRRTFRRRRQFTRRFRKTYKRFRKARGKGKSRKGFAKKVLNTLTDKRVFTAVYGQQHTVPDAPVTSPACVYFTTEKYTAGGTKGTVPTLFIMDNLHLGLIYDLVWQSTTSQSILAATKNESDLTTSLEMPFAISCKATYELRNQSTEDEYITAYYCKVRSPISYTDNAKLTNIYLYMAKGWAQSGINSSNPTQTNGGLTAANFSIFQSKTFLRKCKIVKTKKITLRAGKTAHLKYGCKTKMIRASDTHQYDDSDDSNQWSTGVNPINYANRYGRFILFRLDSRPMGYGAEQNDYSKLISHTTPSIILQTHFAYNVRSLWQPTTVHYDMDGAGITEHSATTNTIINPDTAALGEEKDAL